MVMKPDVVDAAIRATRAPGDRLIYLSPRGRVFDQALARDLAAASGVTLLCGRYEGVDQRALDAVGAEEVSLGDFVLSRRGAGGGRRNRCGGPAAARRDGQSRQRRGREFLGTMPAVCCWSTPTTTRPAAWTDPDGVERMVPEVLVSGDHAKVAGWRRAEAEAITRARRPDLWRRYRAAMSAAGDAGRPGKTRGRDVGPEKLRQPGKRRVRRNQQRTNRAEGRTVSDEHHPAARGRTGREADRRAGRAPVRRRRHRPGQREGGRGRPRARPGIRGRMHRPQERRASTPTSRSGRSATTRAWRRVFPLYSPRIASIEVVRRGKVRRAKLYYLRGRRGKSARIAERRDTTPRVKGPARQ